MSLRRTVILFAAAYFLQLSLGPLIAVRGVMPNFILCLMITIVYHYNSGLKCLPAAIFAAIFLDIAGAQYVGPGALAMLLAAGVVYVMRMNLNTNNPFPMAVTAVVTVVLYDVVYWMIMKMLSDPMGFGFMFRHCAGDVLYDLVLVIILFLVFSQEKPMQLTNEDVEVDGQGVVNPREERWYERFLETGKDTARDMIKKAVKIFGEKR